MIAADIKNHMLGTYVALRRLMAVVTFAFLVTLAGYRMYGEDPATRNSISAYYYHQNNDFRMKDVFIASLSAVGLLLIAYQGYTNHENWALNIAGVGLLLVVSFPMDWPESDDPLSDRAKVHYTGAVLFFLALGYVCLFRAHDTLQFLHTEERKRLFRNLYRVTGTLMIGAPLTAISIHYISIHFFADKSWGSWVYWVEWIGVFVFLSYWVIKSTELRLTRLETEEKADALASCPIKEYFWPNRPPGA